MKVNTILAMVFGFFSESADLSAVCLKSSSISEMTSIMSGSKRLPLPFCSMALALAWGMGGLVI